MCLICESCTGFADAIEHDGGLGASVLRECIDAKSVRPLLQTVNDDEVAPLGRLEDLSRVSFRLRLPRRINPGYVAIRNSIDKNTRILEFAEAPVQRKDQIQYDFGAGLSLTERHCYRT